MRDGQWKAEDVRDIEEAVFVLVLLVYGGHESGGGRQDLVDEDENSLLGRELDSLANHVDELAYGEICGYEILLLVSRQWSVCSCYATFTYGSFPGVVNETFRVEVQDTSSCRSSVVGTVPVGRETLVYHRGDVVAYYVYELSHSEFPYRPVLERPVK